MIAALTAPTERIVRVSRSPSTPDTEIGISPTPMLHAITNWPGRGMTIDSSTGASTIDQVSALSIPRRITRYGRGTIGSATAAAGAVSAGEPIHIHHLVPSRFEP